MRCSSVILALAAVGPSIAAGPLAGHRANFIRNVEVPAVTGPASTSSAPTTTASATCTSYTPVPSSTAFSCNIEGTLSKPDLIRTIKPKQAQGNPADYCVSQCRINPKCISFSLTGNGLCKHYGKVLSAQGFAPSTQSGVYYYSRRCFKCQKSITTTTTSSTTTSPSATPTSPYFKIIGANSGTSADGATLQSIEEDGEITGFHLNETYGGYGESDMTYYLSPTTGRVLNPDSEGGLCIGDDGSGAPYYVIECLNPNQDGESFPLYCAVDPTTDAFGNCTASGGQNVSSFSVYLIGSGEFLYAGPTSGQSGYSAIDLIAVYTTLTTPPPTTTTTSTSTSSPTGPTPFQLQGANSNTDADGEILQSIESDAEPAGFDLADYFHSSAYVNMTYIIDPTTGFVTNLDGAATLGVYYFQEGESIYSAVECAIPNADPKCYPLSCQVDFTTQAFGGCTSGLGDASQFYMGIDYSNYNGSYLLYAGSPGQRAPYTIDLIAVPPS